MIHRVFESLCLKLPQHCLFGTLFQHRTRQVLVHACQSRNTCYAWGLVLYAPSPDRLCQKLSLTWCTVPPAAVPLRETLAGCIGQQPSQQMLLLLQHRPCPGNMQHGKHRLQHVQRPRVQLPLYIHDGFIRNSPFFAGLAHFVAVQRWSAQVAAGFRVYFWVTPTTPCQIVVIGQAW